MTLMRLLVACPDCHRQYDASGWSPGTRFRCHCGAVVTVQSPQGHDAAVVRCSSCGAPRESGATACTHCGCDFTLREQDLDTVCPHCLALVSHFGKFCHHCGTPVCPEPLAGNRSEWSCPACGPGAALNHRQVGDVPLLECSRCAGFWVATDVFARLVDKASHDALGQDWQMQPRGDGHAAEVSSSLEDGRGWAYRKCPACGVLMVRRNYAHGSGVIIDVCKQHGAWFDTDELARILQWVRAGGLAVVEKRAAADAERQQRLDAIHRQAETVHEYERGDDRRDTSDLGSWLLSLFD
jgi:Zn-finger nucleic acid-binding protein